jgi:tetratricopeptide (TPR) repeat protein
MKQEGWVEQIQKCIELNAKLYPPYYYLAMRYYELENYKLSLVYYNLMAELVPANKSVYYNRAAVKDNLNDPEGAIDDYSKALAITPGDYRVFYNRATTYLKLKNYEKAEADLTAFIKLYGNYAQAYYYRGYCRYYLDRKPECCQDMKTAVALNQKDAEDFISKYCN